MKTALGLLLQGCLTVAACALTLTYYDHRIAQPRLRIGVVDVAEVYRQKEAEFTRVLVQSRTDTERERAMTIARQFTARLPTALDELPRDCACLVVVRGSLAGRPPQAVDLTPLLRQKVIRP